MTKQGNLNLDLSAQDIFWIYFFHPFQGVFCHDFNHDCCWFYSLVYHTRLDLKSNSNTVKIKDVKRFKRLHACVKN